MSTHNDNEQLLTDSPQPPAATAPTTRASPRKREFDQRVADRICEKLAAGKSLRKICEEKAMPPKKIVLRWLEENAAFAAQYARAREAQADSYADELIDLARKADASNAHAIRVQCDVIKWVASKLKPKRYGDRTALEVEATVTHKVPEAYRRDLGSLTVDAQRAWFNGLDRGQLLERQRLLFFQIGTNIRELGDLWGLNVDKFKAAYAEVYLASEKRLDGPALPAPEAERMVNAAPQPVDPQDERDDPDVLVI